MHMPLPQRFTLSFGAIAMAFVLNVRAGVVVEENFTYPDGALASQNGGSGWSNAWQGGNSNAAANRFSVTNGAAIYLGGGNSNLTEQNRAFSTPVAASQAGPVVVRFTLIRPETQTGRGIGIYLTLGGANRIFIGKEINDAVGLKSGMAIGSTDFAEFATSGASEVITTTITYNGTNSSLVLSDSDETLAAYSVPGPFTFDGISLAGYNPTTLTNGIDSLSVDVPNGGIPDEPAVIIGAIPAPNVTSNPTAGTTPGSTVVAAGNAKGQSFSLPAPATVSGFVFECDGVATTGSFSVKLYRAMDGKPWILTPVVSRNYALPAALADGDLFQVSLPSGMGLQRGSYLVALEGIGTTNFSLSTGTGALYPTGAAARNNSPEGWRPLLDPNTDLVFAVLGNQQAPPPAPTGKPNILFILADDLGWTDPQCGPTGPNVIKGVNHGSGFYQTPNLARLAQEGLSFTSAYMQPNCGPSRAALISGQYPSRSGNGVYVVSSLNRGGNGTTYLGPGQNEDVPAAHTILPEVLHAGGYVTAHLGKYHLTGHETGIETAPQNQGFDFNFGGGVEGNPGSYFASGGVWSSSIEQGMESYAAPYTQAYVDEFLKGPAGNPLNTRALNFPAIFPNAAANNPDTLVGTPKHITDAMGDAATAFIRDHVTGTLANRPFYMQVHFYAPHTPTEPRPDLRTKYDGVSTTPNHTSRNYAGLVEGLDQNIGRILDRLDDPNGDGNTADSIAANTLVIFLSDNGGQSPTDNNPLRHRKGSFYDGGIRVPMIVRQPNTVPAGKQTDSLVHAIDFLPTLLERAGIPLPSGITYDGESFAAHMLDPVANPRVRGPLFFHFPGYLDTRARPVEAVISRFNGADYKLIYNYDRTYTGSPTGGEDLTEGLLVEPDNWELYNLDKDLSETTDLLDGAYSNHLLYGAFADTMASQLRAWLLQPGGDWDAAKLTVRATGAPVDYPPGEVPDVTVPFDQAFHIRTTSVDGEGDQVTLTWNSEAGFHYDIEASNGLDGWTKIATGITATNNVTSTTVSDPGLASEPGRRFYRVTLTP